MNILPVNLASVLDEIPLGISIISRDRKILFINRAFEALTGFSRRDCQGIPCSHILRFNGCFENCPISKLEQQGKCILDGDIINQDHQKIPVRVSFAPLRNSHGNISAYMETIDDLRRDRNPDPAGTHPFSFGPMIGRSGQMEKIFQFLPVIAQSDAPVLLTGQTGTGKDSLAEAIHQASGRSKSSFVTFRCGALPDYLVESEMFGHEKGAFAGATENKPGKFRLAQNGTLYLAEVGDLAPAAQLKLLNYLDEKRVYPLGSSKSYAADVRVIAASSRNLEQMVQEGAFAKELFFRLNAVSLHLPPLKDRAGDVRLLLDHFLHARASLLEKHVTGFAPECLRKLEEYNYPGNVLELKHIVEYAVNLCCGGLVGVQDLPGYMTEEYGDLEGTSNRKAASGRPAETLDWAAIERRMITDTLLKVNGRRSRAARMLGWGRSTLWRKMKQYGIGTSDENGCEVEE